MRPGGVMKMTTKVPISGLPLPSSTHILPHNLTPDREIPSVSAFRNVIAQQPSIQRRARLLSPESHFSYVSPFPTSFPYDINPGEAEDKMGFVEKWLSDREVSHERPPLASLSSQSLKKFYPKNRDSHRELIGLAQTGIRDCVPDLHVGDAFATLGTPTLAHAFDDEDVPHSSEEDQAALQEMVDVLAGHAVLMSAEENTDSSFAPWSLRYSGHQFGVWAGQLGDGRATSILVTPHPSDPDLTYELQLKGSGRTPFSRSADGLAVVRSSIREFLGAEAMQALSIPTTRSISLVSLPAVPVVRERTEAACVLTRAAPSFIRIGNFEALNPPANIHFLGGGQQDAHWDALRVLGEWVGKRVLRLPGIRWAGDEGAGDVWGRELVLEVARRNARMVGGWQAYGFMHGVVNTDNVSILGLTIDYGPYAFMDVFNPWHICNHSDDGGRYSYRQQPSMIMYALGALLNALSPLIGAEAELGHAVSAGWADGASAGKISEWRKKGTELVETELQGTIQDVCSKEYARLMHKRLSLRRYDSTDESKIVRPLLSIMEEHKLDFHSTFRKLSFFRPSLFDAPVHLNGSASEQEKQASESSTQSPLEKFISGLFSQSPEADRMNREQAVKDWTEWLENYFKRIESEREEWTGDMDVEREKAAKAANPRFVLRQWVLEEVIRKVEQDTDSGKRVLAKVLKMACNPFESWGAEGDETFDEQLDAELKEERRYCGMGEQKMIGFQCSCSS